MNNGIQRMGARAQEIQQSCYRALCSQTFSLYTYCMQT